jgi:hypothetical protein
LLAKRRRVAVIRYKPLHVHHAWPSGAATVISQSFLFHGKSCQLLQQLFIGAAGIGQSQPALVARPFADPQHFVQSKLEHRVGIRG